MRTLSRSTVLAIVLVIAAILGVGATQKVKTGIQTVAKFPATVCPSNLGDGAATAVLPNSKVLVRSIPTKNNKLVGAGTTNFQVGNRALFVDGNQTTSISVTRGSSGWLATTACVVSGSDQWFVGGSGALTSRAELDVVNSGLSSSIVDLFVFTSKGPLPIISQSIPANSEKSILVDTLAPGEDLVAVHAVTRSGRVSTFFLDQRKKGLRSLGADFVFDSGAPANHLVIPAILNIGKKKGGGAQTLRVLAPGAVDATIKASIISTDGTFSPIELDNKVIKHGNVTDLTFSPVLSGSAYSLVIDSDVPVVASVRTDISGEFSWANSVKPFTNVTMNLGGLTPRVLFQGKAISVGISWIDINGKTGSATVSGSDFAGWAPKTGLRRISFVNNSATYGGILFTGAGQIANLPVAPGAVLETAAIPQADARVISRR